MAIFLIMSIFYLNPLAAWLYRDQVRCAMKTAEFFTSRRAKADIKAARRSLQRKGGQPPEPEDRLT